jgi:primosomal protein N' (replication factor Y)
MYADILLPVKIGKEVPSLTYSVPASLKERVQIGSAVRVSLRNRTYTGVVTELHNRSLTFTAKDILTTKEGGQVLEGWQIELAHWVSQHYMAPFHKVLKMLLPQKLWGEKSKIPYDVTFQRTDEQVNGKMGTKQAELIKLFEQNKTLKRKEISEFTLATIRGLEKKGLIKEIQGSIQGTQSANEKAYEEKTLTKEQEHIVTSILKSDKNRFLIHGVTGSGKTEIYLRIAEEMVKQGKQVILMVPEISLTPQLISYFKALFGEHIAVLHSKLSQGEREREWWRVQTGDAKVAIGSRSVVFAPAKNIGLILIDEEHEWSYKQDSSPFYHAREVAYKIAELTGAKVVLGSATPDVETFYKADQGELEKFTLPTRLNANSQLPEVHLADMRAELQKGNFSIFSDLLYDKLAATLEAKQQAILFLNRRGHSSSVLCRDCGATCECKQCDVSLTHHRFGNGSEQLVCHHCGFNQKMPDECSECGSISIKFIGVGTQRVEDELRKRFPAARVLRADRDTTSQKDSFKRMYEALKSGDADIMIGTQMISKGLDLPNVTLVGVILADIGLHIPDFRASERGFQLLTQVAGRSGRADKIGEVVIQTYNPEHVSLQTASKHDYDSFYTQEIKNRKSLNYPPFSRIVKLTFKDFEQKKCTSEVARIEQLLQTHNKDHEIASAPALITRKHNKYRWQIFIQGPTPNLLVDKIRSQLKTGWSIDIDPVVMN